MIIGQLWSENKLRFRGGFEDDAFVVDGVLEDLDFGEEDAFDLEAFFHKELVELLLKSFFDLVAAVGDVFAVDLGEDVADAGAGVGADDFADEVVTDVLPEFGGVGLVDLEKNGAFDTDALVVFGCSEDGLISEGLFVIDIKAVTDGVLENLGVEELGDLPERDFEM